MGKFDPMPKPGAVRAETQMTANTTPPDDLDDLLGVPDLDDLLKQSVAEVNEAKAAKLARERLKRGGTYAEREEDLARIREWEAKHEWKDTANVGLFIQHQCQCGTVNNVFEGLFRRQLHRHVSGGQRWLRVDSSKADLPNETVLQVKPTPVCQDCSEAKGWNTDPDVAIVWDIDQHAGPLGDAGEEREELPADVQQDVAPAVAESHAQPLEGLDDASDA